MSTTHSSFFSTLVAGAAILFISASVAAQDIDYKGFPEWSWQKEDSTEYYLYTPSNLEPGKRYPIALFMHGCCGEDYHATLRNAVDPPIRMWHNFGANTQTVPTYLISPKTSRGWSQHFDNLKRVMDRLVEEQQGDPQRIYVCGFSMGGNGTFQILQRYPDYFAAAIPMGMDFHGDSTLVKDIPIWANQGETDWWARNLARQVGDIRALNGLEGDKGSTWVTGVNPRYSSFKGVGHGVQWIAASTQDLTGWAYSKINDGNKYPVVFFRNLSSPHLVKAGVPAEVTVVANDPDGDIDRVELFLDKVKVATRTQPPYSFVLTPEKGDQLLEAVAYDMKGKTSTATLRLKDDIQPGIASKSLAEAKAGNFYEAGIVAKGNGRLDFSLSGGALPTGLQLYPDGSIRGMTMHKGKFKFRAKVSDEDNESDEKDFVINVRKRDSNSVLITEVKTMDGKIYPVSQLRRGETPNFNSGDSVLTSDIEEINFSNPGKFDGFTYIKTDVNDANRSEENFLSFVLSDDADVYVAYEKLDNLLRSEVPAWLESFTPVDGEIVAQYRYYAIFHKRFPKGTITLPGADAKNNGVGTNYFIMVRKAP